MYKYLVIDQDKNMLLCSPGLVAEGELVEIYQPDTDSPIQACGRVLQKVDENIYEVTQASDGHDAIGRRYSLGARCILHVVNKNQSGTRKRKFANDERVIVNTEREKGEAIKEERKVIRAKTGSVRKKRK